MNEKYIIPISIVIAGLLIGGAFFVSNKKAAEPVADNNDQTQEISEGIVKVDLDNDHILGNPDAEIFVIEYSDLECPFCKRFFDVTEKLKDDFASDGRVAFVWRNFPLYKPVNGRIPHASAGKQAAAAECVADLGGNDKFFDFIGDVFETSKSNGAYPLDTLPDVAEGIGIDRTAFVECYESGEKDDLIDSQYQAAINAGLGGTPSVFVQTRSGETFKATPDYLVLKTALDAYLSELGEVVPVAETSNQ